MINVFNLICSNMQRGHYKYIGSGSSREVYDLRNGYVIKIAKNKAGLAQNKCEYRISCYDRSDLFARVIQVSKDFRFLIMEKAKKVNRISDIWNYFNVKSKEELINLSKIQKLKLNYNLLLGDIKRKNNWGILKGKPVIIDYGFTIDVREQYYKKYY